jgi:hypothetical protein
VIDTFACLATARIDMVRRLQRVMENVFIVNRIGADVMTRCNAAPAAAAC